MFKKVKTRLFNRYLFSIFCVVAIAVILVTLLIFTIYANLQVSSARTYSVHQLEQVCQMTDMLYSQMRSVNNQILQNSNTNHSYGTVPEHNGMTVASNMDTTMPCYGLPTRPATDKDGFITEQWQGFIPTRTVQDQTTPDFFALRNRT